MDRDANKLMKRSFKNSAKKYMADAMEAVGLYDRQIVGDLNVDAFNRLIEKRLEEVSRARINLSTMLELYEDVDNS